MKKIFITGDELFMQLLVTRTYVSTSTKESFGVDIKFNDGGDIVEGRLILHSREMPINVDDSRSLLRFTGAMTSGEKEPVLFSGIAEKDGEFEYAHLILAEGRDTLGSPISQKDFIDLAKKHCENVGIPTDENGDVLKRDDASIFQNLPKDGNFDSGTFIMSNTGGVKHWRVTTILHDGYFPLSFHEGIRSEPQRACFGKFVNEKTIKLFTYEEVRLLGTEPIFS